MPEGLDINAKLTASQAAQYAGVTPQAIINWRKRGYLLGGARQYLPVADHDAYGHPRYLLIDVARAEFHTRKRARR